MPEVWASTFDGGGFVPRYCHVHIRSLQIGQERSFLLFLKRYLCAAVAGSILAACSSQGAGMMPAMFTAPNHGRLANTQTRFGGASAGDIASSPAPLVSAPAASPSPRRMTPDSSGTPPNICTGPCVVVTGGGGPGDGGGSNPPPVNPCSIAMGPGGAVSPLIRKCGSGGGGTPVATVLGPAQYNDQCTNAAEQIGHPVPGLAPTDANRITNEYQVDSGTFVAGYVYTTWGSSGNNGLAYFVGTGSVGAGVSINSSIALPVGTDSFIEGSKVGSILSAFVKFATNGVVPTLQKACFTSPWNGSYPG